jgi:hypothetical protein
MGIHDDIADFQRHKRAQQQRAQRIEQWRYREDRKAMQGYVQSLKADRDGFYKARNEPWQLAKYETDPELRKQLNQEAHANDLQARHVQRTINEHMPRRQPQMDPAAAEWLARNQSFRDRYGQAADHYILAAHNYITRPKIPHETNLERTGMGLQANTPEYFEAIETLLETSLPVATTDFRQPKKYQQPGMTYNPNEKSMTAQDAYEAAATSKIGLTKEQRDAGTPGLHPQDYNEISKALFEAGEFSYQKQG